MISAYTGSFIASGVHRISTGSPDDTSGLEAMLASGAIAAESVAAIFGKTEGNGCVNDFSRGYATLALGTMLERHLPAMIRWIEWMRAHSTGLIRDRDRGNDYGDWLAQGADTPKDLIGTAYFAYSTGLVARSCRALGRAVEAAKYEQLFADIKEAFNRRYVRIDGRIRGDTQCAYAMALKFELLPEELREKAAQHLADDIKAKNSDITM